jgi:hypothetical protein
MNEIAIVGGVVGVLIPIIFESIRKILIEKLKRFGGIFGGYFKERFKIRHYKEGFVHSTLAVLGVVVIFSLISISFFKTQVLALIDPNATQSNARDEKVFNLIQRYYDQIILEKDITDNNQVIKSERSSNYIYECQNQDCNIRDNKDNKGLESLKLSYVKQYGTVVKSDDEVSYPYKFAAETKVWDTGKHETYLLFGSVNVVESKGDLLLSNQGFQQKTECRVESDNQSIKNNSRISSIRFNCGLYNNGKPPILEIQK